MSKTNSELKPCPKCGGKSILRHGFGFYVVCDKCHLSTPEYIKGDYAIHDWNDRPLEDAQSALIEQMGEFIDWLYNSNELSYSGNVRLLTVGGILKKYEEWKDDKK